MLPKESLFVKAAWGRRLAEMGICFKAAFTTGGKKEYLEVLEKMVQHPQVIKLPKIKIKN